MNQTASGTSSRSAGRKLRISVGWAVALALVATGFGCSTTAPPPLSVAVADTTEAAAGDIILGDSDTVVGDSDNVVGDGDMNAGDGATLADAQPAGGDAAVAGMVLIPAGPFKMGCVPGDGECRDFETPQHTVTLDAFYMDVFEVTVKKYKACVEAGKCTKPSTASLYYSWGLAGKEQHPVNGVNWSQADAFCKWSHPKGHLPTEAQWEKAARGGLDGKKYPWGDTLDCAHAVSDDGSATTGQGCEPNGTMAVGSKPLGKNGYGLFDMAGNVEEWTSNWFEYYSAAPASNPTGPASGSFPVMRGGSFRYTYPDGLRASSRDFTHPSIVYDFLGFRCARPLP